MEQRRDVHEQRGLLPSLITTAHYPGWLTKPELKKIPGNIPDMPILLESFNFVTAIRLEIPFLGFPNYSWRACRKIGALECRNFFLMPLWVLLWCLLGECVFRSHPDGKLNFHFTQSKLRWHEKGADGRTGRRWRRWRQGNANQANETATLGHVINCWHDFGMFSYTHTYYSWVNCQKQTNYKMTTENPFVRIP